MEDVLLVLIRKVLRFERNWEGSFRAWLRPITVNKARAHRRRRAGRAVVGLDPADTFLDRLADPNDDPAQKWDPELGIS